MTKRASGRVRKQTEFLAGRSSPSTSSAKRKRSNDEDGDVEMPEEYLSDEELPSEDDEPAEEEIREKKARSRKPKSTAPKKPAQKKPKVNGMTSLPFRPTGATKKKAPKKAKKLVGADAEEAGGLYAEIFGHGGDLQEVATEWTKSFDEHQSRALAEVINFVLKCAGCDGKVTEHDVEDPDGVTNRLTDLQEEYQASNPTDYPLVAKGKNATSFRQSATGFLETIIRSIAATNLLYSSPELAENIQVWLSTMSSAGSRAFRHTATVFSLSVVTALSEVARDAAQEAAKSQRQAESERKKPRVNKERVKQIEQKAKEKSSSQEFVQELLRDWFDTVFIHRYRDVDPTIRRDCVTALGDWIVIMPDVFFDGSHLRYLGWLLSDTSPATRGEVVKQLIRLYKEKDMVGGLKTFTERFRVRMVELATSDAESNVRAAGVELLDLLRENGLLEPDDIDAVGRLVFDSDTRVRKVVAGFLAESINEIYTSKLDDLGGLEALDEALPEVSEGSYEVPRLEWLKLKCLAETLQAYDSEEILPSQIERSGRDGGFQLQAGGTDSRFSMAADALYDHIEEIQEWRVLSGFLLFDHSAGRANGIADDPLSQLKHECTLTEKEETLLLEVLNASVKHGLARVDEKNAYSKLKLSKKQKEELREEQEDAARDLATMIPMLLKKFGDLPSTAAAVLRLESVLNVPSLQELRQDSATYGALLDDVKKQFMSHSVDEVLGPASAAILHAKSYGELDDLTEERVASLWEDVVSNLTELLNVATVTVRGTSQAEELVALSNNLLRIVRLASVSDCTSALEDTSVVASNPASSQDYKGAVDFIIALTQRALPAEGALPEPDEVALEDLIATRAAEASLIYFRWKFHSIAASLTTSTSTGISDEDLEALAARRDTFVSNLTTALQSRKSGDNVSIAIAGYLLDLYSSAASLKSVKPKPGMSDDYTVLIMDLEEDMERAVLKVFAGAEKAYAKLANKRLEDPPPAGVDADMDAEPLDDDPMSDPESDDEDDEPPRTQASQQRRDAKLLDTLLAEQRLCQLAGKMVHAVVGGLMDDGVTRRRLERNKLKLGGNFKEVIAYLDIDKMDKKAKSKAKSKAKAKPRANGAAPRSRQDPKSNAIVADEEDEDEIEDADGEDEEALRRRGLLVEDDKEPEQEEEAVNGAIAEEESALGD